MKFPFRALSALGFLLLASCGSSFHRGAIQHPTNTGPFDSRGNYIEAWADRPDKWNRKPHVPPPVRQSASPAPTLQAPPAPQARASNPSRSVAQSPPARSQASRPQVVASAPKPKPAAKPVVKAAPKPKSTGYVVKSGDNLSKIAARHGSSVTAIQRANGIRGTLIHPGQRLVIPR